MAYLTVSEYIDRYGEAETIRLTDETRSGAYDSSKVEEAIEHAENEVDSYLATRYSIPLASAPPLIRSFVEVLARERLHTTRPTPTVTKDAERVRSQLRDISKGLAAIPGADEGVVEPTSGTAIGASSQDAATPIFTEESLAGFGVPAGYPGACWRQ